MTASINVTTVVGNPKRLSRTLTTAEALGAALASGLGREPRAASVDLAELYLAGIEPPHDGFEHAHGLIREGDLLIIGTPVYKGSYTGLLKLFLDQLPPKVLAGTVTVPVTVAASPEHRLLADLQLRPVLAELGARVPVPSLTLIESELPELESRIGAWTEANLTDLADALAFGRKPIGAAV
ncbi:NADPH-dependent FMN reductase [Glycomyces sp. NRRL B-16210]|uniref:NADPH-dependent FMN reductase n=1 Tax=Glycomyces sp. NRRL B-16210 TaxID=1463821 RepID=UPI00068ACB00|nr:NAD(P)H-dependent oxidoreductase [Glycomyces sp. NRRL B-16210]